MNDKEMLYIKQNGECYIDKDCKWKNNDKKQIEIEKMQQEIFDSCAWRFSRHPEDYREVANDIGEDLYNLGYRNCKDKVVLTKEEVEINEKRMQLLAKLFEENKTLKQKNKIFCDRDFKITVKYMRARKETAREILKWVLETFGDLWAKIDEVYDICDYISKKYGVEIGE